MKFYVLLFSFFLLNNTQGALIETNLSDLPVELLYNIFNELPLTPKNYKRLIISTYFYQILYNYLLEKQGLLLSNSKMDNLTENKIITFNRLLLGHIRSNKEKIVEQEIILKEYSNGKLKYWLTTKTDKMYYNPHNTNECLYKTYITRSPHDSYWDHSKAHFVEWNNQKEKTTYGVLGEDYSNLFNMKTLIIKFYFQTTNGIDLRLDYGELLKKVPKVRFFFKHMPPFVSLPSHFNQLKIISPIPEIYFSCPSDQFKKKEKPSLSLCVFINENSNPNNFNNFSGIATLTNLRKLTLDFDKNSEQNNNFYITCPENLEILVLENCVCPVSIPKSLENLKIISPKEGCKIEPKNDNRLALAFILNQEKKLTSLHIKNDKNNYLKNILQNLEIDQPQNTIIENCAYDQLTPRFNKFESLLLK